MSAVTTASISINYLSKIIHKHDFNDKPVVIGISGIQGSGKSYLTNKLHQELSQLFPALNVVQFSMDDLYLTHSVQVEITAAARAEDNKLLQGRGLPGTHDVTLGVNLLSQLINSRSVSARQPIRIPFYDKSKFNGEGDRADESKWQVITSPANVILLEGWFNGFSSLDEDVVREKYENNEVLQKNSLVHLLEVNRKLKEYHQIWDTFDHFIFFDVSDINNVYKWRLEQEHALLAITNGIGMTDDQVVLFVDRYIPLYYLYYNEMCKQGLQTAKSNLRICIDGNRNATRSEMS